MKLAVNGRFYATRPTGVQRFAVEITRRLFAQTDVTLLAPRNARLPPEVNGRVRVRRGALAGPLWEQVELPLRLRAARCDVTLHLAQSAPALAHGAVVMVHDLTPLTHPAWYRPRFVRWFRAVLVRPVLRASRVLASSSWTRAEVVRLLGVDPDRVDVVSQGLAPFDSPAEPHAVARVRARWRVPDVYLLAAGGGEPRKNVGFLLDVLRQWPGGAQAAPALVVVGAARGQVHIPAPLPAHADLQVHSVGHVSDEDLRALYSGAAAFCFPSLAEGFGRPPLEAMGCRTPAVVANYASAAEVLGDAAITLRLDARAWVDALRRLLEKPAERTLRAERGRRRAAQFDWDRAAGRVLDSCRRAAAERARGT